MKRALLVLIALCGAFPAHAGEMHNLTVNGVERTYYLHIPEKLRDGAPLVIVLHGVDSNGKNDVRRYGWEHIANSNNLVAAGPDASTVRPDQAPGPGNIRVWNSGRGGDPASIVASDDVSFIVAMIEDIARIAGIDRRRVYVAGFSSGGHMANRLGQEIAGRLAAISTSASQMVPLSRPPARGIPVLFSAGDQDPNAPLETTRTELPGGRFRVREAQRILVDRWRELNACPAAHAIAAPADVQIEVSGPCRDGSEVRYILMHGVAHEWPVAKPIGLSQTSWDFFKRFRLPATPAEN